MGCFGCTSDLLFCGGAVFCLLVFGWHAMPLVCLDLVDADLTGILRVCLG